MTPTEIAAAVAIVLGAVAGILKAMGTFSADRRKERRERLDGDTNNAAVLLASWKALGDSISAEVDRVKKSCADEIAKLKAEHEAYRREWHEEREVLRTEIETLKAQVFDLMSRPSGRKTRAEDR